MQHYNIHTHVFTMNNAPKHFLHLYLPGWVADAVDKITNTKAGSKTMEFILSHIPWKPGKRYASFLQIGKSKNQLEVFENLIRQYDETMKFVALTLYMEKIGAGESMSGYEGQLEEIIAVKKQYPDRLNVFLCIDARWLANAQLLKDTVARYFNTKIDINAIRSVYPFSGIKLYPSTGFFVFDENLKETLEWAADNDVPVLSHCNYMGGIYNNDANFIKANLNVRDVYTGAPYNATYNSKLKNQENCSFYLEPESYRTMLQYFKQRSQTGKKDLKICLAHYGGDKHIIGELSGKQIEESALHGKRMRNWCGQIRDLMKDYPNLYTDISYAISNPSIHELIIKDLQDPDFRDRIMFGTDFFLTEREVAERTDYTIFREKALKVYSDAANKVTCWEQIASKNSSRFISSMYM